VLLRHSYQRRRILNPLRPLYFDQIHHTLECVLLFCTSLRPRLVFETRDSYIECRSLPFEVNETRRRPSHRSSMSLGSLIRTSLPPPYASQPRLFRNPHLQCLRINYIRKGKHFFPFAFLLFLAPSPPSYTSPYRSPSCSLDQ
jgi:hypothetical protein